MTDHLDASMASAGGSSAPSGDLAVTVNPKPLANGEPVSHLNALDEVVAEVGASGYTRRRHPETGVVSIRLHFASGDVLVGQGADNTAAIAQAREKAKAFAPVPEA